MDVDDLQQLNEEIVALARAEVPLGPGLLQAASNRSLPGRLRKIAGLIGERLERGESMEEALQKSSACIPPVYASLVEVGARSGNLPAALKSMSDHLSRVEQLRKLTISSLVYPILLVILACLAFAICVSPALARIESLLETERIDAPTLQAILYRLHAAASWIAILPACFVLIFGLWQGLTRRATAAAVPAVIRWWGWIPGVRKIMRAGSRAVFADLLHIMARQQVPMDRAVALAAAATGDSDLIRESQSIVTALTQGSRGTPEGDPSRRASAIPGTIRWLIQSARSPNELSEGLRQVADNYRRRVQAHEVWTRMVVPVLATVLVGGTVTVLYTVAMMGPWVSSLYLLSQP